MLIYTTFMASILLQIVIIEIQFIILNETVSIIVNINSNYVNRMIKN